MPKGPNGQKRPADTIGAAVMVGKIATGEIYDDIKKSSGRVRSGKAGGAARAVSLSKLELSEVAKKAAKARWEKENMKMTMSGKDSFLALLFDEGRELVNLKFFPEKGVTSSEELLTGAYELLSRAVKGEGEGIVPKTTRESVHFSSLVK